LLSADGILSGIPAGGGSSSFQVQVRDSTGSIATSNFYTVNVTAPGRLIVATNSLPVAFLEQPYNTNLAAAGGKGPYSHDPNAGTGSTAGWLILDTKRLPSSVSDYGADLGPVPPPGLTLDLGGKLSGTPTQAGNFTLLVQVTDSSMPPQVATDVVLLTIIPADGLQILNTSPPQATLRKPYSLELQTTAQDPKAVVFFPVDSSGHNSPAARAALPPGITLSQNGLLSGVPITAGAFPFLVQATDGQGRIVIQALQVTVVQGASGGGGCATLPGQTSAVSSLLLLGLVALGLSRRNRR
jgi:large repetitive protein